jgi:hypothetical protein
MASEKNLILQLGETGSENGSKLPRVDVLEEVVDFGGRRNGAIQEPAFAGRSVDR